MLKGFIVIINDLTEEERLNDFYFDPKIVDWFHVHFDGFKEDLKDLEENYVSISASLNGVELSFLVERTNLDFMINAIIESKKNNLLTLRYN